MANYDNFYTGSSSPLSADYSENFPSYNSFKRLGAPTSTQTANQVEQVNRLLNQGMKTIELSALSADLFETIPKEHLKEINQLSKLTGNEMTMHGPVIDPSGFTDQGWSENQRAEAERRLSDTVIRAHELNPEGNIPVVIHASSLPAGDVNKREMIMAVNQDTGQMMPVKKEEKYYPGREKITYTPEEQIRVINETKFTNDISNLLYYKKNGDEDLSRSNAYLKPFLEEARIGRLKLHTEEDLKKLSPDQREVYEKGMVYRERADAFYEEVTAKFNAIYDDAMKYGTPEAKEKVKGIGEEWKKVEHIENPEERSKILDKSIIRLREIEKEIRKETRARGEEEQAAVEFYKPIEDFAIKHSAETIGKVALAGYNKFGDTSPIIAVENMFPNMAFSTADELGKLIKESRKQFVNEAVNTGKLSRGEAERQAEKLIGATWDTGHLNLLRKGYGEKEAKEMIMAQTKEIAPLVKHVHLSDNFGHADTHLPPGMGNVPVKKIMEELEKRGFSGKQIIEATNFVQHFKVSPVPYILDAMNSPLYSMKMAPTWRQAQEMYGAYSMGYGPMLPEHHFGMYGGGFSSLPAELGGQVGGTAGRRFSGTPME